MGMRPEGTWTPTFHIGVQMVFGPHIFIDLSYLYDL